MTSSTSTSATMKSIPVLSKDEIYAMECEINHTTCSVQDAISNDGTMITILGFGSLLSKKSSQLTFPNLINFRLVHVPNYQRLFIHPTSIFFQRNIANLHTMEMASLSCEYNPQHSFIAIAFEIPVSDMIDTTTNTYTPKSEFVQREEEFAIIPVPYNELDEINQHDNDRTDATDTSKSKNKVGMICARSTDDLYFAKWGYEHFKVRYEQYGLTTIWNYNTNTTPNNSNNTDKNTSSSNQSITTANTTATSDTANKYKTMIKPCTIYLYHCYIASQNMGIQCYNSFLDDTYLIDRTTTIRQYLNDHPLLFHNIIIPNELKDRYCG